MNRFLEHYPTLYIDIRSPQAYSKGHLVDSINVPLSPAFRNWVLAVLERKDLPITIVYDHAQEGIVAHNQLKLAGFDNLAEPLHWNEGQLRQSYLITENPQVPAASLKSQLNKLTIIDVRTLSEWQQAHINGALHIELDQIKSTLEKIPRDKPIRVICAGGNRSSIAVSFLKAVGFQDVQNIEGGMRAWGTN